MQKVSHKSPLTTSDILHVNPTRDMCCVVFSCLQRLTCTSLPHDCHWRAPQAVVEHVPAACRAWQPECPQPREAGTTQSCLDVLCVNVCVYCRCRGGGERRVML